MKQEDIQDRVKCHLDSFLSKSSKDWFVISAVGSMNYNLFDDNSDVDTKLLTFPNLHDLAFEKEDSRTDAVANPLTGVDEQCDVKDVRRYLKIMKKANINFLEILASDYYIVNPLYEDYWNDLRAHTDDICGSIADKLVYSSIGMMYQKAKRLCNGTPSTQQRIDEHGYDSKQLLHIKRLNRFVDAFIIRKMDFADSIWIPDETKDAFTDIKNYSFKIEPEIAEQIAIGFIEETEFISYSYLPEIKQKKEEADSGYIDYILEELIAAYLKNTFGK